MSDTNFQIWLVRHGETEWSRQGRHTGWTDVPLTDAGRERARQLAGRLARLSFDAVHVSPLRRARDTAAEAGFAARAQPEPDLREWNYGEIEGRTSAELAAERGSFSTWHSPFGGGESLDAVGQRADRLLARLRQEGGRVLLFSHGHFLRILASRWIGAPAVHGERLALDAASLSQLGHEHATPVIRAWNLAPGD